MATWITHLRVCDLTKGIFGFDGGLYDMYIIGSLAPDSGTLQPDGIAYFPPRRVLHRTSDDGKTIFYDDFYAEYVKGCRDDEARAFYLGYYAHLLTDHYWGREVYLPMRAKWREQIDADRRFIWRLKKQWYDLDREYLRGNICPSYERLKSFRGVEKQYLSYIEPERLNAKLAEISHFYDNLDYTPDPEYRFMSEKDIESFIGRMSEKIKASIL